jgi:membrane protease YdiL (CAAX protease family)
MVDEKGGVQPQGTNEASGGVHRTRLAVVAWASLLLYPIGIYWSIGSDRPMPLAVALGALGAVVLILALVVWSPALRPLRGHLLAVTALSLGGFIVFLIERTEGWRTWSARVPTYRWVFADSALELIPCALLALTLVGSGLGRRDVFVARGDLERPALMLGDRVVTWRRLAWVGALLFAGPLAVQLAFTVHPDFHEAGRAAVALPPALGFAALNAAQEEFRFRTVLLARLAPVVGASPAMLMTATVFGIGHWNGHPSGPTGVLMTAFAGWWLARSMIKTRGSLWAWSVHAAQDVLIFLFLVMAAS